MSTVFKKPDLTAPRYRPKKLNLTNIDSYNKFIEEHPRYAGISLEKFIGNRKGQRTDLNKPVENSPQVCLLRGIKTRELISQLLDLGSDYTYRQIKKIILHESDTLTEEVRNKKISIFYAASIIRD